MIDIHQIREETFEKSQVLQEKIKKNFDKKVKAEDFELGNLVLKWNVRYEDKGKHGKFNHLWQGPYKIFAFSGKNAYFLQDVDGNEISSGPVNGRFLKHYLIWKG